MISDDDLDDLPDDPALAFVALERKLRQTVHDNLRDADGHEVDVYKIEYINHVLAGAKALGIREFDNHEVPLIDGQIYNSFNQFLSNVDHYTMHIRVLTARRRKKYSVALDPATKSKIRHYLDQIKKIVDHLEAPPKKKEAIYSKINDLVEEIDRERTRFDTIASLIIDTSTTVGTSAKEIEPLWKWVRALLDAVGIAKDKEDTTVALPAPTERKKIEPPRQPKPPSPPTK